MCIFCSVTLKAHLEGLDHTIGYNYVICAYCLDKFSLLVVINSLITVKSTSCVPKSIVKFYTKRSVLTL